MEPLAKMGNTEEGASMEQGRTLLDLLWLRYPWTYRCRDPVGNWLNQSKGQEKIWAQNMDLGASLDQ